MDNTMRDEIWGIVEKFTYPEIDAEPIADAILARLPDIAAEAQQAKIDVLTAALMAFHPQRIGVGQSTDMRMLHDAWVNANNALGGTTNG